MRPDPLWVPVSWYTSQSLYIDFSGNLTGERRRSARSLRGQRTPLEKTPLENRRREPLDNCTARSWRVRDTGSSRGRGSAAKSLRGAQTRPELLHRAPRGCDPPADFKVPRGAQAGIALLRTCPEVGGINTYQNNL